MSDIRAFADVDWCIPPENDMDMPSYRCCDLCYESAAEDACAGKSISQFRQFYRVLGGDDNGLVVCEHCMDKYLSEKPT